MIVFVLLGKSVEGKGKGRERRTFLTSEMILVTIVWKEFIRFFYRFLNNCNVIFH